MALYHKDCCEPYEYAGEHSVNGNRILMYRCTRCRTLMEMPVKPDGADFK
jgi:hypothetical protein